MASPAPEEPASRYDLLRRLSRITRVLLRILLILSAAFFLGGRLGNFFWRLELLSHFTVYYLIAFLSLAILLTILRSWRWAFLAMLLALWPGFMILPWYFPVPQPDLDDGTEIRMLVANVLFINRDPGPLMTFIDENDPDVIFLQETGDTWKPALEKLKQRYPHSFIRTDSTGNYGIAQFHRLDETAIQKFWFGDNGPLALLTHVRVHGRWILLLNIHGVPPASRRDAAKRWAQMHAIAFLAQQRDVPLIAGGDLNITMWSPHYRQIEDEGGMVNARRGHGILANWPVRKWDWFGPLNWWPLSEIPTRIPLDHILVTDELAITDFRLRPDTGSDHFPLIADILIPPQDKENRPR